MALIKLIFPLIWGVIVGKRRYVPLVGGSRHTLRDILTMAFIGFLLVVAIALGFKATKTSKLLRDERKAHQEYVQLMESKNKPGGSSDSGNGIKARSSVMHPPGFIGGTDCLGEHCSFLNQPLIFGEINNGP